MIGHSHTAEQVLRELNTDRTTGLSASGAAQRLEEYGENRLKETAPPTLMRRFLRQMKDPMVIILLLAALVSLILCFFNRAVLSQEADWIEPIVIVAIVLLNALLGVVQESRAEASLRALQDMAAPNARVLRDGQEQTVPALTLVPGDILMLEAGDQVPADCRLLESFSLHCNESALTGESLPVEKIADRVFDDITPLADRANMLYAGCDITKGKAVAVAVATGMETEMGHIAKLLAAENDSTPLQHKMAKLSRVLGLAALVLCVIIFAVGVLFRLGVRSTFMTAVSLAVAAIPEGLPAIVTIVLSLGVQRMVKKNAIIRRLPAVETLGSASVICSDKTGTLTQNRMTLRRAFVAHQLIPLDGEAPSESLSLLIQLASLCTDATLTTNENGDTVTLGDPTETAILTYGERVNIRKANLLLDMPIIGEIPFDSERKRMTTVHHTGEKFLIIVKGAPESVLPCCTHGHPEEAEEAIGKMAQEALRVLAVAYKLADEAPVDYLPEEMERDLTFIGLLGMIDPPRPEVKDAIAECDAAGIRTVMITGDNVVTAAAIATELGILHPGEQAITGQQLDELDDLALEHNITKYRVYARVTPADKIRIVRAWKKRGEVVAMTGDGVNDAPALKAADIGCAMGITGTEVSKGAADMVLTDDRFSTIVAAVKEGRGIYDNIRKAIRFLLSCNFGELLTVFLAMLLWHEVPISPVQLLWLNLVTDGLPALALGMEPPEKDIMRRAPRRRNESLLPGGLIAETVGIGVLFAALTLIAYRLGMKAGGAEWAQTMAFFVLAGGQLVHAFNMRSSHSLFAVGLGSNPYMLGAFGGSLLLLLALLLPGVRVVFGITLLPPAVIGTVIGLSLIPLVGMELYKLIRWIIKK